MLTIDPSQIICCTHAARLSDHAANPDVHLIAPDDDVPQQWWASRAGDAEFAGKNKDQYHADIAQALSQGGSDDAMRYLSVLCVSSKTETGATAWIVDPRVADLFDPPLPAAEKQAQCVQSLYTRLSNPSNWARFWDGVQARVDAKGKMPEDKSRKLKAISRADWRKIASFFDASEEGRQEMAEVLRQARRIGEQTDRLSLLPVPSRLKQIIVPGPQGDVILTPLAPLPLLRQVAAARSKALDAAQDKGRILRRFQRLHAGASQTQNTGIRQAGALYVLRDDTWSLDNKTRAFIRPDGALADAWIKAWRALRAWLLGNGLPGDTPSGQVRSDLMWNLQQAADALLHTWQDQTDSEIIDARAMNFLIEAAQGRSIRQGDRVIRRPWGDERPLRLETADIHRIQTLCTKEVSS